MCFFVDDRNQKFEKQSFHQNFLEEDFSAKMFGSSTPLYLIEQRFNLDLETGVLKAAFDVLLVTRVEDLIRKKCPKTS